MPPSDSAMRIVGCSWSALSCSQSEAPMAMDIGIVVIHASIGVSIPPDAARKVGQVQWPTSLPGDPRQSFVTVSADHLDKRSFTAALSAAAKGRAHGKVLLFVHGFNNRFDEAVYRFAQIVHDSGAPAVPVLFSWPSRGAVSLREICGVPRIFEIQELHALDDTTAVNVEAGNDAFRQHGRPQKFSSNFRPTAPDFSGWNCTPNT